jgi:hypothetical protein
VTSGGAFDRSTPAVPGGSETELDDKIHWEEIGRVLTRCLRMAELEKGINRIRQARPLQTA